MLDKEKKNLIVILSRFPYPLEKGDKLRAYYQIKELSKSFNISLICISEKQPTELAIQELKKYCTEVNIHHLPKWKSYFSCILALFSRKPFQVAYFFNYSINKKIERKIKIINPDHIFCQLIRVAEYVKNYHDCPKTLDYMDAFSTGIERRIKLEPFYLKWLFKLESKRLVNYERSIYDYFEIHTIISEQDKSLMGTNTSQRIKCIPNGVAESFFEKIEEIEPIYDLVFVGNLNYPPNVEAVKFIVQSILPRAEEKGFEFSFIAAGAAPTKTLLNLRNKAKRIEILPNPVDIRTAYLSGKVFVAPMKIGTGLQNKLLEAMALGVPSITTKLANNALNALPNESILIAESPDDFINQIISLTNKNRYDLLSDNGKSFVENNFNWSNVTKPLIDEIKNV